MKELIISYMKEFGAITTLEACYELGCTRLAEYIRLIKKDYVVGCEWVTGKNRYGKPTRYKKYWLEEK